MDLATRVKSAPLLRTWKIPDCQRVCCVCRSEEFHLLPEFMNSHPHCQVELLLVPYLPRRLDHARLDTAQGTLTIPAAPLEDAAQAGDLEKVVLCGSGPEGALAASRLCRNLDAKVYLYAGHTPGFGIQQPLPDFYNRHEAELERVYNLLADEASRQVYAGRIRALMTGDAGYIPLSTHEEYYHPRVRPEKGDIMLDGGVSDMVDAQRQFARSVGETGCVFGFEPIPEMAAEAQKSLARFPQYHLYAAGLGESPAKIRFKNLRDSSYMDSSAGADSVLCDLTSVDAFVSEHHLYRINCLKLDVEGSEMLALRGSRQTILRHRPKLIVCLYHKPPDMVEIPLFIHELARDYKFYMAHSSCLFTDTILYALPGEI